MNEYKTFYDFCEKAIHIRNLEIEEGGKEDADNRFIGRIEGAIEIIGLRIEQENKLAESSKFITRDGEQK